MTNSTPERWLPIPGFHGWYDVSDQGNVRSWLMKGMWRELRLEEPRIVHQPLTAYGYKRVILRCGDRVNKQFLVHRLVLLAFVGPPAPGAMVLHWDDCKTNNKLSNLRYGYAVENSVDMVRNGTKPGPKTGRTHCSNGHLFTPENTLYVRGNWNNLVRNCRTCAEARRLRKQMARRERALALAPIHGETLDNFGEEHV